MNRLDHPVILFFDDWYLNHRENLVRRIGQPRMVLEGVFQDPYLDVHSGYPSVFQDPGTGKWRCLYQGVPRRDRSEAGGYVAVVAESHDGIRWTVPDLSSRVETSSRQFPHQVLPVEGFFEWATCYFDANAEDPAERVKALASFWAEDRVGHVCPLHVSPDGLSWQRVEGVNWHPWGIDPAAAAFWNRYRGSYCITARPSIGDRRVSIYETRDWRSFSKPELLLQSDALDTPAAELYGMPVFPYGGMFVGLLWIFHTAPTVSASYKAAPAIDDAYKFLYGRVDSQLAYSYNGWHFQRGLRDPFLANSGPGEYGSGLIYPSSLVVTADHKIRIYSSSSMGEHGQNYMDPKIASQSAILLHELRLDGFSYFESAGGAGSLTTRVLFWQGEDLRINVKAPFGEVRVQVEDEAGEPLKGYQFEDCIPFAGDDLFWMPRWKNGRSLSGLRERVLRFAVRLINGALYGIRGDFVPVGPYDLHKFRTQSVQPKPLYAYYLE
jgi:hypothetical protein